MPDEIVSTGIAELDKMLGGGLPLSSVVLLRGGPGSGKSTLAVQILHNIIHGKSGSGEAPRGGKGIGSLVCLETPIDSLLGHMKDAYGVDLNDEEALLRLRRLDGNELRTRAENAGDATPGGRAARAFLADVGDAEQARRRLRSLPSRQRTKYVEELQNQLRDVRWELVPKIVVVDSLTVLPQVLRAPGSADSAPDTRALLEDISRDGREILRSWILLLVGEYDPSDPRSRTLFGESFFCDVEIDLTTEKVRVPRRIRPREQAHMPEGLPEERFFCRVLKSRERNREVRRCSYDFVDKKGVVFYETYPGDGRVVLFQENARMREEWRIFETRDIPDLYPTLAFETFDRSGLQRTFASHRRLARMPERTDLLLHSFDTYWVNWYAELRQRTDIARILLDAMKREEEKLSCPLLPEGEKNGRFSQIVGKLHRVGIEHLKQFALLVKRMRIAGRDLNFRAVADEFSANRATLPPYDLERACSITEDGLRRACPTSSEGELEVRVDLLFDAMRWDQDALGGFAARICDEVCPEPTTCNKERCQNLTRDVLREALTTFDGAGLLEPIPFEQLRLYGERKSGIISELEQIDEGQIEGRPIFRPFGIPGSKEVIAVPYYANVGFLVVNQSALEHARKALPRLLKAMRERDQTYENLLYDRYQALGGSASPEGLEPSLKLAARRLRGPADSGSAHDPETWEEVLLLCEAFAASTNPDPPSEERNRAMEHTSRAWPFLIETKTFDTYLATFMEALWSCGGVLDVHPDYQIEDVRTSPNGRPTRENLMWAFRLFRELFGRRFTPGDCCLEPWYMRKVLGKAQGALRNTQDPKQPREAGNPQNVEHPPCWLFARFWHSTLVDVLTRKKKEEEKEEQEDKDPWVLGPEHLGSELRLIPIPVSLDEYHRQTQGEEAKKPQHHSCWGEWYLAIMKGSENTALGIDLINNLMSSHKIAERAFQCAAVPTTDEFYKMYGKTRCLSIPERDDIELPKETWNDFRRKFLVGAKSRTAVFDYRHCMRELHAVLEFVRAGATARDGAPSDQDLNEMLDTALDRIQGLAEKHVLLH